MAGELWKRITVVDADTIHIVTAGLQQAWDKLRSVQGLVLPLVSMYAGQYLINRIPQSKVWGLSIMAAGSVLLLLRTRQVIAENMANLLQIGLGLLINLPLALNVDNWKPFAPPWGVVAVWLVSCLLVAFPLLDLKPKPIQLGLPSNYRFDRRDLLILVLLIGGALLLRVPRIESVPAVVDPDEGSLALSALNFATGEAKDPFATGWATHPHLQFLVYSLFIRLLGRTYLAMRLPSAIVGALAVGALYLLARIGYGRRVAMLAGVLALSSNVAIHFSRSGLNNITDSLFFVWVMAALWAAGATGQPWAYVIWGVGLGLAQYYYFGNRAIPFVVAASFLVWIVADRKGVLRAWPLIVSGFLVSLVVAGPLIGHWLRFPNTITEHLGVTVPFTTWLEQQAQRMNVPLIQLYWEQVYKSLLVFAAIPDQGSFYNSGQPMLHPLQGPLFLIGLAVLLTQWRRPFTWGLWGWMLVNLVLGSMLITTPATFHRLLGVLPAGILVVAIGIDAGMAVLARAAELRSSMVTWLVGAIIVILALVDIHYYFWDFNVHRVWQPPWKEAAAITALEYEHLHGQGTFVLYTHNGVDETGRIYHTPINFVAGDAFLAGTPQVEDRLDTMRRPLYLFIWPDRASELSRLKSRFPSGTVKEYRRSGDGLLLMTRYVVTSTSP